MRPHRLIAEPATDPILLRTLAAAGLPATGSYVSRAGWVSRVWVGADHVVRLNTNEQFRDAYRHEARVVSLLSGSAVPHARHIAHGDGPDGPWYISERLPGRTMHDAWPTADSGTRQAMIESLGVALRALHRIPVPPDLLPPWLAGALVGLFADVAEWVEQRLQLFNSDDPVLVHGDLHGSNVMVDRGRVTGIIDFAEAVAQPADAELDTILRWCATARDYPPTPHERGLDESTLTEVPRWLHAAYPELFARPQLRERLHLYDMYEHLTLHAHHPDPAVRDTARDRITRLLSGHSHLDRLDW